MLATIEAPAWAPACMDADEWALWEAGNRRIASKDERAARPCSDCPLGHAADMRAEGRCNGTPSGVQDEDEDGAERADGPADPEPVELAPAPVETEPRETPGQEGGTMSGPTERQQEAWDLVTKEGLTQLEAADRLAVTHAGLIYLLRAYQAKTGTTGALPGRTKKVRAIRPVDPAVLDAPATTSAPEALVPPSEADPSSAAPDPADEPTVAPAPADPSPGAGSDGPSAPEVDHASVAGHIPETGGAGGMAPPVDPGTVEREVAAILDAECARLEAWCRVLASEADRVASQRLLVTDAHEAALRARDAYRALVSGDRAA